MKTITPYFSVVIPLYNKRETIGNTLRSVMAQTFGNFEVVIVDDGSTDGSVDVICECFNDSRIRIITQKNGGVSAARNHGIEKAHGEWIAFLDGDDEWMSTYLEEMAKAIEANNDAQVVMTSRYGQNFQTRERKSQKIPARLKDKVQRIEFFENPHFFQHISATTMRADLLKEDQGWNRFIVGQKYNEDFTFVFRVILHCSNVIYIGKPLSVYNGNVSGQTTSIGAKEQKLRDGLIFRNEVYAEYERINGGGKLFKTFMRFEVRHAIICYLRQKDYNHLCAFLDGLSRDFKCGLFHFFECPLYRTQALLPVAKAYILFTKIIWKAHGFPQI